MKRFWNWLSGIFNRTKNLVVKYIQPSVQLVENLKIAMESPMADVLTMIIPGNLDDMIKVQLRQYLPIVLQELKICEKCIHLTDPNEIVKCALEALKTYDTKSQYVYLNGIASKLADCLSDGKITWGEIVAMVEYTYAQNHK